MQALFDGVRLTPTQRRIAQCVLEQGAAAGYLSSGELADLARVSQPSVTRFAMALGYDGYPGLRQAIRDALDHAPPPRASDPAHNEWQVALTGEAEGLTALAARLADGSAE